MANCVTNSCVNDYILHLISVAPKSNGDLQKLLEIVLKEYNSLEHAQEVDSLLPCVKEAVQQVVRCYRGLVALISPQFGILGSTPSDVFPRSRRLAPSRVACLLAFQHPEAMKLKFSNSSLPASGG